MKPDYKNWVPNGMVYGFLGATGGALILTLIFGVEGIVGKVLLVITIVLALMTLWMFLMHRAFSYNGSRQMSKQIIDGVSAYVKIPDGGKGLDVGCGSGALTIACAKKNPNAQMVGIDRWGKEYASFSKTLCESNAEAEGAANVSFGQGDATKLGFEDETFDAVTSNYVYHNIPSRDRQAILLETLRTLKKGGTFVIHDIMSKSKYGDIESFAKKLKDMGYEDVRLVDTTSGMFMNKFEATWMGLSGSTILMGKK
ncbi:class I SAM-dependent methyltransferase [Butyrivibrio sp. MC2021]|jgi:ubiquinone/menaquinone biosynthesis C-methylase UbiE|uniref:class I SAM-dependent methyltransferase n=1 Tax=Butyrivibrio sp. MC2021 TaxID=1408306 RepID=UPI000478BDD6|nr:class I SAM-dependent methyltransferase [Butyrivibrio sp. MC2021]